MSHIIYQTEGVVLNKADFGEADRLFTLFTEDFGKIKAVARGVRNLKSKLRYNLDLFSFSRFGLISSGEYWKILNTDESFSSKAILLSPEKFVSFSRFAGLVDRMVQGEGDNLFLWNQIKETVSFLAKKDLKMGDLRNFEISTSLALLGELGYIDKNTRFSEKEAVSAINKAIKESML